LTKKIKCLKDVLRWACSLSSMTCHTQFLETKRGQSSQGYFQKTKNQTFSKCEWYTCAYTRKRRLRIFFASLRKAFGNGIPSCPPQMATNTEVSHVQREQRIIQQVPLTGKSPRCRGTFEPRS
jgi:hypothetical protein